MIYNITAKQKAVARSIAKNVNDGTLQETFFLVWGSDLTGTILQWGEATSTKVATDPIVISSDGRWWQTAIDAGTLEALTAEGLLRVADDDSHPFPVGVQSIPKPYRSLRCTITQKLLNAVSTNFAEGDEFPLPVSTLAQPHPPEIAMSLDRLRSKYPDPKKLGFLIMRLTAAKPFARIVDVIKATASKHCLIVIRADENEFHADLWGNVRTHLHGCGFGVAIYERIETEEPNANVGLEVGYLMAMNKPVLLLKDKTVATLPADLAGKLYKPFDPHDPQGTIPNQLCKWLEDNGVIVPKNG